MLARRTSDILRYAFLYRQVEYFATGSHHNPFAVRRDTGFSQILRTVFYLTTRINIIRRQLDLYLFRLLGSRIHFIKITSIFKNDRIAVCARELHIVFREISHFSGLFGLCVVDKEIHRTVTIREEEYLISDPHRDNILCDIVRNVFYRFLFRIIDPDIIGHTALIIFPGTEFTHHAVIGQLFSVRRIATETAFRQRDHFRKAAFFIHRIQFPVETTTDTVTVNDTASVRSPVHYDIVRSHAVAQVITLVGCRIGNTQRFSSRRRDRVHFRVSIVLSGKCNCFTIRRKTREHFIPNMRSQTLGLSTCNQNFI